MMRTNSFIYFWDFLQYFSFVTVTFLSLLLTFYTLARYLAAQLNKEKFNLNDVWNTVGYIPGTRLLIKPVQIAVGLIGLYLFILFFVTSMSYLLAFLARILYNDNVQSNAKENDPTIIFSEPVGDSKSQTSTDSAQAEDVKVYPTVEPKEQSQEVSTSVPVESTVVNSCSSESQLPIVEIIKAPRVETLPINPFSSESYQEFDAFVQQVRAREHRLSLENARRPSYLLRRPAVVNCSNQEVRPTHFVDWTDGTEEIPLSANNSVSSPSVPHAGQSSSSRSYTPEPATCCPSADNSVSSPSVPHAGQSTSENFSISDVPSPSKPVLNPEKAQSVTHGAWDSPSRTAAMRLALDEHK